MPTGDFYKPFRRSSNGDFEFGFHALVPYENRAARLLNAFFDDDIYAYGRRPVIEEHENDYAITLELPGFKQTDLDLTLERYTLTIAAKRGEKTYSQSIVVSSDVDPDTVAAKLEDGLLVVTLTKSAKTKPRKVPVK